MTTGQTGAMSTLGSVSHESTSPLLQCIIYLAEAGSHVWYGPVDMETYQPGPVGPDGKM